MEDLRRADDKRSTPNILHLPPFLSPLSLFVPSLSLFCCECRVEPELFRSSLKRSSSTLEVFKAAEKLLCLFFVLHCERLKKLTPFLQLPALPSRSSEPLIKY